MNNVHIIWNYLHALPWQTIVTYIGGSAGIASLLQILKHKLNFADAQKLIVFVLGVFSLLASTSEYFISNATTSPLPTIFGNGSKILALAVIVHRFAISPAYDKLVNGLGSLIKDAQTYRASIAPQSTTNGENPDVPVAPEEVQTFSV